MKTIGTLKIHMLSTAASPITHMMGVQGNESILNREKVLHDGDVVDVPVLSGNALRHRMIREPGALYLVDACGLRGKLNIDQANYMFTGGSLTESSTTDNLWSIAKLQEISPLYRLLGGSLRNQIIGGSLFVGRGVLVCDENKTTLEKVYPEVFDMDLGELLPANKFISKYQYTRGDASRMKDAASMVENLEEHVHTNLMIYAGESVVQGAIFYHDLVLYNVSPLEVGAALHAVTAWQNAGGTIGGSARIGHGRLNTVISFQGVEDWFGNEYSVPQLIADYMVHVDQNKEAFAGWLAENFK